MPEQEPQFDAVIVGAGFAGMYMLHRLRQQGLSVQVFEAGGDVGGTWYWNRYPGARCDVESMEYCYQFSDELQQDWNWSERYSPQPEILAYANHVAERFDLRSGIEFNCTVAGAVFNEETGRWQVSLADGRSFDSQFCIFATGCLSSPIKPDIPGRADFSGRTFYTAEWPHEEVDFTGRRVGVIGTGSSAIQSIPLIAEQAAELFVFQRTPNYSVPAWNESLDPQLRDNIKANYPNFRARNQALGHTFGARHLHSEGMTFETTDAERQRRYEQFWRLGGLFFGRSFADIMVDPKANLQAQDFVRNKIREQVRDPKVADLLSPSATIGCKRLCADTGYFQTYNLDHVTLVDIRSKPIEQIYDGGIRTAAADYELDDIVFATGFDAMTGALTKLNIVGRNGVTLKDKWGEGPLSLLGVQVHGFPNMFTITGPGSPSVLSNMIQSIEQHVEWISDYMVWMKQEGLTVTEPEAEVEQAWMDDVALLASQTLFVTCNSWYRGKNVEGKSEVFMPRIDYVSYVAHCNEVAATGYPGFSRS
jgi:cation diffusion facilitator CzcD-associated flavoprotein CzcO